MSRRTPLVTVDLIVEDAGWDAVLPELDRIATEAARLAVVGGAPGLPAPSEISILACDDSRIAALNADFRGKPAPTNVLSWPAFELRPKASGERPPLPPFAGDAEAPLALGDVAIALQTVEREAAAASIPLKDHATHLILHACLHLLGYDHQTDADAALMEGIERRQLLSAGIPDPYQVGDAASPPDS